MTVGKLYFYDNCMMPPRVDVERTYSRRQT